MQKNKEKDYAVEEVSRVLGMIMELSKNDNIEIKEYEYRAIKYIAGELVANTFIHSCDKEKNIIGIGIYIERKSRKLFMTMCDAGKTIVENILEKRIYGVSSPVSAIEWSLQKGNTTKKENKQGGMGLYRIRKIISDSKGEIGIKSLDGLYHIKDGKINCNKSLNRIKGTVFYINLELDNINESSLKLSDKKWNEIRGGFLDENSKN